MSMRECPFDDYGLVVDKSTIDKLLRKFNTEYAEYVDSPNSERYAPDEIIDLLQETTGTLFAYISGLTGEYIGITDEGMDNCAIYNNCYEGTVYYIPCANYPSFFKTAYSNMDEMVAEFRGKVGRYLPEDFPYRENISHIVGTYWG